MIPDCGSSSPYKNEARPNASNIARHCIIDDILHESLHESPNATVIIIIIIIGCGHEAVPTA